METLFIRVVVFDEEWRQISRQISSTDKKKKPHTPKCPSKHYHLVSDESHLYRNDLFSVSPSAYIIFCLVFDEEHSYILMDEISQRRAIIIHHTDYLIPTIVQKKQTSSLKNMSCFEHMALDKQCKPFRAYLEVNVWEPEL